MIICKFRGISTLFAFRRTIYQRKADLFLQNRLYKFRPNAILRKIRASISSKIMYVTVCTWHQFPFCRKPYWTGVWARLKTTGTVVIYTTSCFSFLVAIFFHLLEYSRIPTHTWSKFCTQVDKISLQNRLKTCDGARKGALTSEKIMFVDHRDSIMVRKRSSEVFLRKTAYGERSFHLALACFTSQHNTWIQM